MKVGERIKCRRESLGITQTELAERVQSTKQNIYKYESGVITNIPSDKIELISTVLGVSPAYLMGWEDESDNTIDFPQVRYAGPVAAHFDAMPVEEYEYRPVPPAWLGRRKPDDFFIASVDGDSMYPHYQHGDELFCLHCNDMGQSGRIGIMLLGDGVATLKTIIYKSGEDWVDLVPANPEYKTRRIEGADLEDCRVVGRVLRVIRTVGEM